MRHIKFLIPLICTTLFFSCSEEEEVQPNIDNENLVGTWELTGLEYFGNSSTTVMGFTTDADFTGEGRNFEVEVVISEDPNSFVSSGTYTVDLKTTTLGVTQEQTLNLLPFLLNGDWSIDGNIMTITNSIEGEPQEATLLELSETTMKMNHVYSSTTDIQGTLISQSTNATYTLTKK